MKCPYCASPDSKVIDSRPAEGDEKIRRRRECIVCKKRFTTYEIVEHVPIMVIKKDGKREEFDPEKLLRGLVRACEKRPVAVSDLERVVSEIETEVRGGFDKEIESNIIGELAMNALKKLDDVAYVRFASVYRQFKDIQTFMDELMKLVEKS